MNYKETNMGRCLTKYTHPDYDQIVSNAIGFVRCQLGESPAGKSVEPVPKCFIQEECHALMQDGTSVKLMYIIDSSD